MPTKAKKYAWEQLAPDHPIALLERRRILGERMMVAQIHLDQGCTVDRHAHENEQISVVLAGRLRFLVGEGASEREVIVAGGEVLHLPSNVPHAAEALEDTLALDLVSPPGAMGVDRQGMGGDGRSG